MNRKKGVCYHYEEFMTMLDYPMSRGIRSEITESLIGRRLPVPKWVKSSIDFWVASANLQNGILFRCVSKSGKVWADSPPS
jgi:hypothetical protein